MKTLSVMGQTYALAPPKRAKLPNVLVSHLKDTDHAQEIQWLLDELARIDHEMTALERRETDDPWEAEELDEAHARLGIALTQAVGDIQAHIGYLREAKDHAVISRLSRGMERNVLDRVEREVPGILTGNWQYLVKDACPW